MCPRLGQSQSGRWERLGLGKQDWLEGGLQSWMIPNAPKGFLLSLQVLKRTPHQCPQVLRKRLI